jgi:cobyric acid synthase
MDKEVSSEEKFKRVAWFIANNCFLDDETTVVDIYKKLLEDRGMNNTEILNESNKT